MIAYIEGKVLSRSGNSAVVLVGGLGLKIAVPARTASRLPEVGAACSLFTHLHVREDALDLYGFESEEALHLFEMLISVSGVGPKSALSVLDVAELSAISAAIKEGRPDLLTQASGIGRKTAERIVIDLRGKVQASESADIVGTMDVNADLEETLVSLGYGKAQAKSALEKIDSSVTSLEERLRMALGVLGRKGK